MLNLPGARGLPEVVGVGEEHRVGAKRLLNGLDGLHLILRAGDGVAVGVTLAGPAGLEVHDIGLARANVLENVDLALDELAGLVGTSVVVEEGVDVGTDEINSRAERRAVLLPDIDGLGGGDIAVVSSLLELLLGGLDEAGELTGIAGATLNRLVTNDDESDHIPLGPLGDSGDLLLGALDAGAVDEDTDDHLQAALLSGGTNVLETVAVSGIHTDGAKALRLDERDILHNLGLALAATVVGVGRVGHSHAGATRWRLGEAGGGAGRSGGGVGRSRSSSGRGDRLGRLVAVGERRADVSVVGLSDSQGLLRLSVSARGERGGSRVDDDGARGDKGSRGSNGVGTRGRADVGRGLDDTGDGRSRGLDRGDGAGHGGRGLDHSGDTAIGVATTGQVGRGGTADGGSVGHGQSGRGDSEGTSGREAGDAGSRELDGGRSGSGRFNRSLGRGLGRSRGLDRGLSRSGRLSGSGAGRRDDHGDSGVASRAQGGGRLGGDGGGWLGSLDGDDCYCGQYLHHSIP